MARGSQEEASNIMGLWEGFPRGSDIWAEGKDQGSSAPWGRCPRLQKPQAQWPEGAEVSGKLKVEWMAPKWGRSDRCLCVKDFQALLSLEFFLVAEGCMQCPFHELSGNLQTWVKRWRICLLEWSLLLCKVCLCSLPFLCFLPFLWLPEGDGANDVSMIQVADIGIGISGQEGMQVSGFHALKYHELDLPIQGQHSHREILVVKWGRPWLDRE